MLPGYFFDMTNQIATHSDIDEAFELYHKERKKFKKGFTDYGLNFANRALTQYNQIISDVSFKFTTIAMRAGAY